MTQDFPNGYALLIGVDKNQVAAWALPDVAKDVAALKNVLVHPQRCAYRPENVRLLLGEQSSGDGIWDGLAWLGERLRQDQNATAVIYYSGHGFRDTHSSPPAYYLVPYDVTREGLRRKGLAAQQFAAEISALQPRRLLLILDCCHAAGLGAKDIGDEPSPGFAISAIPSGLLMGAEKGLAGSEEGAKGLELLATGAGRAVLSSSQGEESSYIRADRSMSIFTYHLIEALTGHAQPQQGATEVLVSDVMSYVYRRVPESARKAYDKPQTPDYQVSGNFPVALLLGGQGLAKGLTPPDPLVDAQAASAASPAPKSSVQVGSISGVSGGTINIAGGDINQSTREINTGGGAYFGKFDGTYVGRDQVNNSQDRSVHVGGNASGNTFITGDQAQVGGGMSQADFIELLRQMQALLAQAGLPPAEASILQGDLSAVQQQMAAPAPNKPLVLSRLSGVVSFVANAARVAAAAPQLVDMARQALEWAQKAL